MSSSADLAVELLEGPLVIGEIGRRLRDRELVGAFEVRARRGEPVRLR